MANSFSLLFLSIILYTRADTQCNDLSPDCPHRNSLCDNAVFKELMRKKCARSCGLCSDHEITAVDWAQRPNADIDNSLEEYQSSEENFDLSAEIPTTPLPITEIPQRIRRGCEDHVPNCYYLRSLCGNEFYYPVMAKNCRRSCGFCEISGEKRAETKTNGRRPPHSWHGYENNNEKKATQCRDRGLDCATKLNWCTHWRYWRFMRGVCALSCGFCDTDEEPFI